MRYGFCTGFVNNFNSTIDYPLLDNIRAWGYDYVEFPLMTTQALGKSEFTHLCGYLKQIGLAADVTCNMFPGRIKLAGKAADTGLITNYLDTAFARMAALGTYKVVFGSSAARDLPEGMGYAEGLEQITALLNNIIIPRLEKYNIQLVMEPISAKEANFITSLRQGMEVVQAVNNPRVTLLADSVHMLRDNEDMGYLHQYKQYLDHIHVSELERRLPTTQYSEELASFLTRLTQNGYDKTISFEPVACAQAEGPKQALQLLKGMFQGR